MMQVMGRDDNKAVTRCQNNSSKRGRSDVPWRRCVQGSVSYPLGEYPKEEANE